MRKDSSSRFWKRAEEQPPHRRQPERSRSRLTGLGALLLLAASLPSPVHAGGFDIPDLGAEALGRGGAFVAKADSPLALYYNVAGMGRQKGTQLLIDVNLLFHDMSFTRAGVYPGMASDPSTPWAGQPYPTVHNSENFGYQPFIGLVTDGGGVLKNWRIGIGAFAPPGIGKRQYGEERDVTVMSGNGKNSYTVPRYEVPLPNGNSGQWQGPGQPLYAPSPARYDIAATDFLIFMPTLAVSYSPAKYIDIGIAAHWVVAQFDITKANVTPLGPSTCGASGENPTCDSYGTVHTTTQRFGATISLMGHPTSWLDLGFTYRPQINIDSSGQIHAYPTPASATQLPDFPATFSIVLPHTLRFGARVVSHYPDGTERADLELDGTWENWSAEKAAHVYGGYPDPATMPLSPPLAATLTVDAPHNYLDGGSVRLGFAYNFRINDLSRFIVRGGFFFDAATTKYEDTHLDAYTMAKYAGTVGFGLKIKGLTVNLAYAGMYLPSRTVTNETARAPSANNGTQFAATDPVVIAGNGRYDAHIHTVSIGLTINFSQYGQKVLFAN